MSRGVKTGSGLAFRVPGAVFRTLDSVRRSSYAGIRRLNSTAEMSVTRVGYKLSARFACKLIALAVCPWPVAMQTDFLLLKQPSGRDKSYKL